LEGFTEKIRDHFTDDAGNYKCGLRFGWTTDQLLEEFDMDAGNLRNKMGATGAILSWFARGPMSEGYKAGGIGFNPRWYIIAKGPAEQKLLLLANAPVKIGHLKKFIALASGVVDTTQITRGKNQMEKLLEDLSGEKMPDASKYIPVKED
jgi:hypothetical protein